MLSYLEDFSRVLVSILQPAHSVALHLTKLVGHQELSRQVAVVLLVVIPGDVAVVP